MHPQVARVTQSDAVLGALGHQARVGQEDHGVVDRRQRLQDGAQTLGIVGVLRPVDGGQRVSALGQIQLGHDGGGGVDDGVSHREQDVGHHVAHDDGPIGQPLVGQMGGAHLGRCQQQVGGVVGQDPVDLLGHGPVEGPQARLQVRDGHMELDCRQGPGQRGVRVPVDQDPVGTVGLDGLVHGREHRSGLHAVRSRADPEVDVRGRDSQVAEEDIGEHRVIVLPGVNNHMLDPGLTEGGIDRG